jgi:outer membrane receptor protein involved in Fe transport
MNASISRAVRRVVHAFGLAACGAAVAGPVAAAQLEEIVVTAQKREQNLLDVPLAVSAISGQTLEATGIESVADFEFLLPSLVVAENSGGGLVATALVTRGIGVNGNIPYFEPSTALFIDGAYRSRSAIGLDDLVNIDRVEYLRGPQSTLHGRNASAGVLSIYTKLPRDQWGGFVELTGYQEATGRDPFGFRVKGETSGPVSEDFGAGISFSYHDREDLYTVTGSELIDSVNGLKDYSIRGQIAFEPNDTFFLRVTGGLTDRDHNGPATELFFAEDAFTGLFPVLEGVNDGLRARQAGVDLGPEANELFDLLLALGAVPTPEGVTVTPPHNSTWDRKIHLNGAKEDYFKGDDITVNIEWNLPAGVTLSSVTSYNDYEGFDTQDIDQLTMPIGLFEEKQWGDAFSQELRLSSASGEGSIDWLLGAYYLQDKMRRQVEFQLGPNAPILGVGINGDTGRFNGGLDTDSFSIFGQVNWRATDKLEVAVGARWIDEDKDGFKINSNYNGDGPASPVFQAGGFAAIFDPADSGDSSLSTSDTSYSLTLNYKPSDSMLLYGLYSRGFKSGGFNVVWGPIGPGDPGFIFGDETVDLFEAGLKGTFVQGRLQASVSAFHQTHDDYQTAAFIGTIFNLSNAEEARTQGVELDLAWAASESWLFSLNAALIDAQYVKFTRGPCHALATPDANGFCDQSGDQLPFVAEWTANVSAEYRRPLANGTLRLRADAALSDDYNPDLVLAPFLEQDGYTRVSLRAGWENERFGLTAFVNNITDEEIVDWAGSANVVPGASGQFVIQSGRTYGLTARVSF